MKSHKFKKVIISLVFFALAFSSVNAQEEYSPSPTVVSLVNKGIELHKNRDFPNAIRAFLEALSLEPKNEIIKQNISIAHNNFGKYLAERTDVKKAEREFRLSLYYDFSNKTASSNLEALLLQQGLKTKEPFARKLIGDRLRSEAEFEGALVEYKIGLSLADTPDPDLLIGAGDIHYIIYLREGQKTEDMNKSLDLYKKALAVKETAKGHVKVGDGLLGLRDVIGAIDHYKRAVELEPDNSEVLTANVRGWNEAVRLAPLVSENHIGLGQALQLKKNYVGAGESYRQALKLAPNNIIAQKGLQSLAQDIQFSKTSKYLDLALSLQGKGKYDEAIEEYVKAIEMTPSDAQLHYNIGTAFQAKNDFSHAEKAYKKALEIDPENKKAQSAYELLAMQVQANKVDDLISRALEFQQTGNYQEAITTYKAAISSKPDDAQLAYNLGTAYQAAGDLPSAFTQYNRAKELDSSNASYGSAIQSAKTALSGPHINSAIAKQTNNDIQGAINDYMKALEYVPDDAQTHFNLATAFQAINKREEAIAAYKKAAELDPTGQADALFFIATIYEEKKDNQSATNFYQKYLSASPSGTYVQDSKEHIEYLKSLQ